MTTTLAYIGWLANVSVAYLWLLMTSLHISDSKVSYRYLLSPKLPKFARSNESTTFSAPKTIA